MSDGSGFFQAVHGGICGFSFVAVFSIGCVEDIVDDLKGETDPITIDLDAREICFRSAAQIRSDPDCSADERGRFRAMNPLELLPRDLNALALEIKNLTGDHSCCAA